MRFRRILFGCIILGLCLGAAVTVKAVDVSTFAELKENLYNSKTLTINLTKNITISSKLTVIGKKTIKGAYTLRRKSKTGEVYEGVLIQIGNIGSNISGHLSLDGITIHGSCDAEALSNGVSSQLIQVHVKGSMLELTDTILKRNNNSQKIKDSGGAILVSASTTALIKAGTKICDNKAGLGGGAIRVRSGGVLAIEGGEIYNNSVCLTEAGTKNSDEWGGRGGAIHNEGNVLIGGGRIYQNKAIAFTKSGSVYGGFGGAIYNVGTLTISGGKIDMNVADTGGGGIAHSGNVLSMTEGDITANTAKIGGGIYVEYGGKFSGTGGSIDNNKTTGDGGGGIYATTKASIELDGVDIVSNTATDAGGGIFNNNESEVKLKSGSIENNTASTGGGVYNSKVNTSFIMESGTINNNLAQGTIGYGGGGIRNNGGKIMLSNGTIRDNMTNTNNAGTEIVNTGVTGYAELTDNINVRGVGTCAIANYATLYCKDKTIVQGKKYAIRQLNGELSIGGSGYYQYIYLGKEQIVNLAGMIENESKILLEVEDYHVGRKLVTSAKTSIKSESYSRFFDFVKRENHYMRSDIQNLYIGSYYCTINFDANGGSGTMASETFVYYLDYELPKCAYLRDGYAFLGWSIAAKKDGKRSYVNYKDGQNVKKCFAPEKVVTLYAVWRKKPVITGNDFILQQDEYWNERVWMWGLSAKDEEGNVVTNAVQCLNHSIVNTKNVGIYKVNYRIIDSEGVQGDYIRTVTVVNNQPPVITSEERYLWLDEAKKLSQDKLLNLLCYSLECSDDHDDNKLIKATLSVDITALRVDKGGVVNAVVKASDQFGHRFYMKAGDNERYGVGKTTIYNLRVHVINPDEMIQGYPQVRFINDAWLYTLGTSFADPEYLANVLKKKPDECEEIWHFNASKIAVIKGMLGNYVDITNEAVLSTFIADFSDCRKGVME